MVKVCLVKELYSFSGENTRAYGYEIIFVYIYLIFFLKLYIYFIEFLVYLQWAWEFFRQSHTQ